MKRKINLLIPMSGQGTRYQRAGYTLPKPLITVSGESIIKRLFKNFPDQWPTHCVIADNHVQTDLPKVLSELRSDLKISIIKAHSLGPGEAILTALKNIPEDEAVLVSYCDYAMVWDAQQFECFVNESDCDACLISYRGFHAHYLSPVQYAYSRLDGELVKEVREKGSFTDNRENEYASCGAYYFKTAKLLKSALDYQYKHKMNLNGEFYTSLTVQALIELDPQLNVRVFEIPYFFQWGTPEDLQNFEFWEKSYKAYLKYPDSKSEVGQVLMPMAGFGSRFKQITQTLKPLIKVYDQSPMFLQALKFLPKAKINNLVTIKSVQEQLESVFEKNKNFFFNIKYLEKTPDGQALSVEAGLDLLNDDQDVLVSACDHGAIVDPKLWKDFRSDPQCEAAIFTVKGFPGVNRRPQAFAYVSSILEAGKCNKVNKVSVKSPISSAPLRDELLIGTFWFKNKTILKKGIELLKSKELMVNNEYYLDSVFELLIDEGFSVRSIPVEAYIGWGDPDSLAEALYWYEVFTSKRIGLRNRFPGLEA